MVQHLVLVAHVVAAPDLEKDVQMVPARDEADGAQDCERDRLVQRSRPEDRQSDQEKNYAHQRKEN